MAKRGMGNAAGIMRKGSERAKQLLVIRQRQRNCLMPFTKAHQKMRLHRQIAFKIICHRRGWHAQHIFGCGFRHTAHGGQRWFKLTQKHRAIDHEMVIVLPVAGIDVKGALALIIL